jgi:hypothetical protein
MRKKCHLYGWINKPWQRRRLNYLLQIHVDESAAECLVNGRKALVVTVHVSPAILSDD